MILEGDTRVIDAIKEKKRLMDAEESHDHIRLLLIVDGGFMKGAYGVGATYAFSEADYIKVFETHVGISSGAITLAYWLTGDRDLGASIVWEECCSKELFSLKRWKNPENTAYLEDVMQGKTGKQLEAKKLINGASRFYIGLADFATAQPFLLKPKTREECVAGIRASCSIPGAASDPVLIGGTRYVDGAFTYPHILSATYEKFTATHVLVITNQDKDTQNVAWLERLLGGTLWRARFSTALRQVAPKRRQIRHDWINSVLEDPAKSVCFVWGNGSISSFERDAEKVKNVVEKSREWWREILAK